MNRSVWVSTSALPTRNGEVGRSPSPDHQRPMVSLAHQRRSLAGRVSVRYCHKMLDELVIAAPRSQILREPMGRKVGS